MLARIRAMRWDIALLFCVSLELTRRAVRMVKFRLLSMAAR